MRTSRCRLQGIDAPELHYQVDQKKPEVRQNWGKRATFEWNVRFSPFVTVESGPPFDITIGRDLYGMTLFNARPGIPNDPNKPGLIRTSYGLLDPNPTPNQKILPRNYGHGPGSILVNLRVAKTIEFDGERKGAAVPSRTPADGGGEGRPAGGVFNTGGGPQGVTASSGVAVTT